MNKKIILAAALIAVLMASVAVMPLAHAASDGPRSGTTFANVSFSGSDSDWASASNAAASDNVYATTTVESSSDDSDYLRATGFGFDIPTGATITGITASIERKDSNTGTGHIRDNIVRMVKNNVVTGDNKAATSTDWSATDTIATYGSSSDLWGTTWTPADINNANFGLVLSVTRTSGGDKTAEVDHITITVNYSLVQGPSSGSSIVDSSLVGTVTWSNPGNAASSDNAYATAALTSANSLSHYLRASDFGFSIPAGATIDGIEAKIERSRTGGGSNVQDNTVALAKSEFVLSFNRANTGTNWPSSDETATYGGPSDLWGLSWSPSDINDENFGLVLSAVRTSGNPTARVDQITITVYYTPNTPPTADSQNLSTDEDTSLPITLTGNANDAGQTLTFEIVTGPSHGTLTGFDSGTGAVTYNPEANYNGPDSFTFRVNDGFEDSSEATVSITVNAVNDAPVADDQSVSTDEDTLVNITLTGSDVEGGTLSFSIVDGPSNGVLSGTAPNLTYTPNADFNGADSFTFKVNDGALDSNIATVSITVNAVNDAPVADDQPVSTDEDTSVGITLTATDLDGDTLTFEIVSGPSDGVLSGTAPNLTYTPSANFNGPDSFTFKVNDGTVDSNIATVDITVNPINDAPVANDDSDSTDEDNSVTTDVLANDTDVDGDTLTVTSVTDPANGTAVDNGDGTITYTPDADFNGVDSYDYTISDGDLTDTATVTITVNAVNDAPVADDQSVSTDEDTPLNITLTGSDIDGDSLTFEVVSGPSNGVLSGTAPDLTYTPNADFNGPDSFTFKVNDGTADSNIATIDITVNAVNDAPVANDDSDSTDEDSSVNIDVLANDTDVDGDALSVTSVTDPANGTAAIELDGTVTYTPNADFNGIDSFDYTVSDGDLTDTATVTITVNAVNDAPVANDDSDTTNEDTSITTDVLANDTDVDGDTLTVTSVTDPANGTAVDNGDGTITYTPDADFNGVDSYDYTISDGDLTDTATVTITVNAVNDAPVADDQSVSTDEDTPLNITLTASDVDGDALTYEVVSGPSNGVLSGTAPDLTYTPNADFNGADSFTFKVNDGTADSNIATIDITVNAVNDAPVADDQSVSTDEDTSVNITLTASDVEGDTLTFEIVSGPANGLLSGTAPDLTYEPGVDFNGADSFTFKVNDGALDSNIATVSITVNPVNDAPEAVDDSDSTDEDTSVNIDVLANDSDVDGDALSVTSVTDPANGTAAIELDGTVTYTPNADFNGIDSFDYTISDGEFTSTATVTVTVNAVNDAPVANDDSDTTNEDTSVTTDVLANDTDVDGDTLSITSVTDPANGTAVDNGDGTITYTPDADFNGVDSYDYTISDGDLTDTATVTITVNAVNDAPVANDDSDSTDEDTPVTTDVLANDTDVDGDLLTIISVSTPADGTATDNGDGTITYTPNLNFVGIDTYQYTISDGEFTSTATVTIDVGGVNDAPVADDQSVSTDEDTPLNITLTGSDIDGDSLTFEVVSGPANGVLSGTAPDLTYTPDADFNGPDSFTFKVNDGTADSNIATVDITVNPINDAPVADDQSVSTDEDTSVGITLTGTDVDGDSLTFEIVSGPSNGLLTGTAPDLTYEPGVDFNGADSFTFKVNDGALDSNIATVSITVNPVNDAPEAVDDSDSTDEDTSVNIDVLANDTDVDGDTLAVTSVTDPANGTAAIELDGTVTYTPNADFNGIDSFDYTVSDGDLTDVGTVTITVNPVNDAPVANDDSDSTDEDTPVTTDVLANDTDVDGDALTVTSVTDPANGTAVNNGDGTVTYTPDLDFIGIDSYDYTISDGSLTSTATVTIDVGGVNDAPVADDQSVSTDEDTPLNITLTGSDIDGDSLTYSIVDSPANGVLSGTAPDLTYTPNADFNGADSFTFKVNDGELDSNIATVSITVNPVNDVPVADDQSVSTDENVAVAITLTASDVDGDSLTWTITQDPANGVLSGVAPDLTYTPNTDFDGADSFKFKVNDGTVDSNEATVSITVNNVDVEVFPVTHMNSDTATFGLSTFAGRQAHVELVTATSELVGDSIDQITLKLRKAGSPTGIAEIGVFNEDLTVKKLFGTINAATLSTSYADYTFNLTGSDLYTIEEGDRIGIKFTGGSSANSVAVMTDQDPADPFDGTNAYHQYYTTAWVSFTSSDLYMVLTQTHGATDNIPPVVDATPIGGTYPTERSVALTANEPATIYYTLDGSEPTTSSDVYTSPILISSTTTLKFMGQDTAGNTSAVKTEVYTITPTTFPVTHMSDTTQSFGLSTHSGRQVHVEFVSATSQLVGADIDQITLKLRKAGAPTGTFEVGVFNEDLTAKKLFGTMNAEDLTLSYTDYTFSLMGDELYTIEAGDRIGIKFTGGDAGNSVAVMTDQDGSDPFDGTSTYHMYYTTTWINFTASDLYMVLTQTHD